MITHNASCALHTPALRATPLHRGDSGNADWGPLYEEGCPKGWVCRTIAIKLIALVCGLFLLPGCKTTEPSPLDQPLVARFYMELRPGTPGIRVQLPVSKVALTVNPKPVLVEYDITNVEFAKVDLGWCLYFQFSSAAARDLYRLSAANLGGRLVLTLNDAPVGARVLDQPITDGSFLIFVEVPDEELPPIAERLKRTSAAIAKKGR
jgi:hypothetical protein